MQYVDLLRNMGCGCIEDMIMTLEFSVHDIWDQATVTSSRYSE